MFRRPRDIARATLILALSACAPLFAGEAAAVPPNISVQAASTTGSLPKGVTLAPDGKHLYVTNYGVLNHRNISIYDAATLKETQHIDVPGIVVETAISPDGKTLYASNFRRNSVQFIDVASRLVTREVKAGAHPKILVLSRDGKRLFAANWGDGTVTELDTVTGVQVRRLVVQQNPRGMAITKSGRLYVANFNSKSMDIFDGPELLTHRRVHELCAIPRHLVLSPDESKLYVSCLIRNEVLVFDVAKEQVVRRIPVGRFPKAMDVTRDGRYVVTADYRGSTTTVIDTKDWTTRTIDVPGMDAASGIVAARGSSLRFYVTGWYDDHLYSVGVAGAAPEYTVSRKIAEHVAMMRLWHRKHPVE